MSRDDFRIIFDWDGVLIDSSRQHKESWSRLAREINKQLPPGFFNKSFGMKNEKIIMEILFWADDISEAHELGLRKEIHYRQIIQEKGISFLPGVEIFIKRLRIANIPFVIGSSTQRVNIDTVLDLLHFNGYFDKIVSAEDVTAGKPDPQVFIKSAQLLGNPAPKCVVFEDALVGIEAARAANMKVVAVTTTNPRSVLQDKSDIVVDRLDEVTIERLNGLFST
ncbi:MAG: HAD family phosphatase [Candidatus Margulisiibacteriota bacterium]|nr:MAG: hypothetical protein A2X43_02675 [Candidatus Margulisbacteria bacterium GWD2_39_127]OGI02738.1 MAG: hypothetical protein A2X42_01710 [Candidatus Margulisbacteria bacterium GWF2_38_17]OGI09376.1 MAG: hypothetical protein A2X41_09665 [Candidatus Margulisbacteria bacterium GWE2_39_32]PZM84953.1 MAG: HAD family phosphatase [Candidatus Margulisiibacteriota bacterium]HAR63640.1 HAD family phosphatase [Candidatus Margulisiibacteriota bacterium]